MERLQPWFMEDKELTEEAFNIHSKMKDQNAEVDTQEYWDKIDIELYRNKKSRLLRYFSHNNLTNQISKENLELITTGGA